ncbi:ABC transporter permease subunit [Paenibacillus sp. LMG 31458]|uniref:ABC transporter permease subunit n=1 Tax=Paenibacillus phytorum TaxID=2654977 RepID=A0ABX1XYA1_9BACL|nr:carbohydrate ABC transporter permease [Paenibacillus phytorum]NOU73558.1 ABC transporter permease subunit [Paenibacillus phytorum]
MKNPIPLQGTGAVGGDQKNQHDSLLNRRRRWLQALPNGLAIAVMTAGSLPLLAIYVWMVLVSFSDSGLIPTKFTLSHWSFLWSELNINGYVYPNVWVVFLNTLFIAVGTAVFEVAFSLMAGYAISQTKFPGRSILLQSTILTHAFPAITGLIAAFYILNTTGLLNTLTGIMALKILGGIPMSTWIIKGFFDEVPKELTWAAQTDGCGKFKIFYTVFLPKIWPGVAAISLFAFLSGWGEYVMVSVFIFDDKINTLSIIIKSLFNETSSASYGLVMALATFYMLPCVILYFFSQKALSNMKM